MHRLKKAMFAILVLLIGSSAFAMLTPVEAEAASVSIAAMQIGKSTAYVNSKKTAIDPDNSKVVPITKNGRTMIPLRFCAATMGGTTKYISDNDFITVKAGSKVAQFKIGSKTLNILDSKGKVTEKITLDVAPLKTNGRVMVPVRAVTSGLGFEVFYKKVGSNEYVLVSSQALTEKQKEEQIEKLQGKLEMKFAVTAPKNNANVEGSIKITGYALSEYTTKIKIVVDGKTLTSGASRTADNALLNANDSRYRANSPNPGFTYTLNTGTYAKGSHTIVVTAVGSDGRSVSQTLKINVTNDPTILPANKAKIPFGVMESPTNGTISKPKSITIKGWAVHPKDTRVDIYIDGSKKGTATRTARSDILTTYPSFSSTTPKPGFSYSWNAESASSGRHVIVAKVVDTATGNTVQNIQSVIYFVPASTGQSLAKVEISTGTLNVRNAANGTATVIGALTKGQIVELLSTANADWWKIRTLDGKLTGYSSSDYLTKVDSAYNSGVSSFTLTSQGSLKNPTIGQTLYIEARANGANANRKIVWKSSNTGVANVYDGYVYGYKAGTVTITASNIEGTYNLTRSVTVKAAEPIVSAYTSPNIVSVNETVNIIAVTDSSRDFVQAVITNLDKTTTTLKSTTYTISGMRRIFTIPAAVAKTGTYEVKLYSGSGSTKSTDYDTVSIFASSNYNSTTPKVGARRPTDSGLKFIADWEGYSKEVYIDSLGTPTIGYGLAIFGGNIFYDVLSNEEAWAMLVQTANGSYATKTSEYLVDKKIKVTQWQYDSMVSFAYNVGASIWTTSASSYKCKLRDELNKVAGKSADDIEDSVIVDAFTRYHKNLRGVFYRRLDEAQMFNSKNYARDNWSYAPYNNCPLPPKDGKI